MRGKFYAVSTGPGDPLCMTLQAKRILESIGCIAVPVSSSKEKAVAYNIVKQIINTKEKAMLRLTFSMEKDQSERERQRDEAAKLIMSILDKGMDVAMITLGDVSVYSTCTYIYKRLADAGYDASIIPGVTSFSAGAAKAGISLCEGRENFAVVSASDKHERLSAVLDLFDNVVIMKAGICMDEIYELLREKELDANAFVISSVGMEKEKLGKIEEFIEDETIGYFTTVIVKKKQSSF